MMEKFLLRVNIIITLDEGINLCSDNFWVKEKQNLEFFLLLIERVVLNLLN